MFGIIIQYWLVRSLICRLRIFKVCRFLTKAMPCILHPPPPHAQPVPHVPMYHCPGEPNGLPEELVLQSRQGDGEVDDGHLDADLREVVRVGHFGCHVEPACRGQCAYIHTYSMYTHTVQYIQFC